MEKLTAIQEADLRMRSAEVAIKYGTKVGLERNACLDAAKKIYAFALGTTDKKAPEVERDNG